MKHVLLLAITLAFVVGSSVAHTGFAPSAHMSEVEGVTFNRGMADLKPGYRFERESVNAVAVVKIIRHAHIQTGTITCVSQQANNCTLAFGGTSAKCGGSCYFVGSPGGVRAP